LLVGQIEVRDPSLGKTVVRLRRTDPDAPEYPPHYELQGPSATMKVTGEDRQAAQRLLLLLDAYEAELIAAGKTRATINTYVDRTERFLKRRQCLMATSGRRLVRPAHRTT
jgi:hypothetical protein